jgi:aminobenzoyl-glutamate utilization protein B
MRAGWVACLIPLPLAAQTPAADRTALFEHMDARADHFGQISRQIWEKPETQFQETRSSALLKKELTAAGFRTESDIGGMATAFIASAGKGKPVIAILGEFDALPGLSQDSVPIRKAVIENGPGHGCGHNLFGAAAALAAVTVKEYLAEKHLSGTIRFYGTPAEEGGAGKIFMIRAGAFQDVDTVLVFHPWDSNSADNESWLANVSAKVRFRGIPAHAAAAPEAGRSALDALEVMTHAVNLMREHVPETTRMHYIVTKGGNAPNIVPDFAELSIIVRHPDLATLEGIWERVLNTAQAGALATETTMETEMTSSVANYLPNDALIPILDRNLRYTGGVHYTEEEKAFIEELRKTMTGRALPPVDQAAEILPPKTSILSASTDVGDVSWVVPTGSFLAATFPPGTALHTWQSTACAGSSVGRKGMMVAAKTLALTATDLFNDPEQVAAAKAAFEKRKAGREYRSLLPANATPKTR